MANWTPEELSSVGEAEELQVASRRADGSLRPYVTIWVVRVGDELYIRSAYGPDNPWYVRAVASGAGRIRAGGVEQDVTFGEPDPSTNPEIDATYRSKYKRFPPNILGTVVTEDAVGTTIRLDKAA